MSTVNEVITCDCWSIGADSSVVRLAQCHHRYFRGDRKLTSVSEVLRSTWPFKKSFDDVDPATIENARDRGVVVDELLSAYVVGKLQKIPAGTRKDAVDLFRKVQCWWDAKGWTAQSQVILADDRIAGTCDLIANDNAIYDLKATYEIEPSYQLQLGAYADLFFATFKKPVKELGIIHVTARFSEPKLIKVDLTSALQDWMLLRDTFLMAQRRVAKA